MDRDELDLFAASLRSAVAAHSGPSLDGALAKLGWHDALQDDRRAIAAMFATQGEFGAASGAIDDVIVDAVGLSPAPELGVVLPPLGQSNTADEGRVIRGFATHRALTATELLIVAPWPYVVPASQLERRTIDGIDPMSGWVMVTGRRSADANASPGTWDVALPIARLAIAQELASLSRSMLELARTHAVDRVQFGRPIGSFQAVRHRLADALLAVESADAAVAVGWDDLSPYAALMAKAIAGRTSRTVAKHSQQVLAGMGFTAEHGFHLLMKRAMVLDQILGAGAALSVEAGRQAIANRSAPAALPL